MKVSSMYSVLAAGLALAVHCPLAQAASGERKLSGEEPLPPLPEDDVAMPIGSDTCDEAEMVEAGMVLMGSTVGASTDDVPVCGSFLPDSSFLELGGTTGGVWYMIEGTGSGLGAEVNATYDVQIAVFTGPCGNLTCVDGTAGGNPSFNYGEIKGGTEEGEIYYILVGGWEDESGDFVLTITEGEVPENGDCEAAPMITIGEDISGTTEYAIIPERGTFPPCTIAEALAGITAPTVFYTVMGNGEITQFSVFADYDAWISIYAGDSCDMLECVNTNDDSPLLGDAQSVIAQPLDDGVMYYINVHGYEKAYGDFTISSEVIEPAANDECSDAQMLELDMTVSSNTLAATADPDLPFCGRGSNSSSVGVFFSLIGTGNTVQITLAGSGLNLELHFSIYTGDCDDLTCAGNRFIGFLPFVWDTVEGELYSIFVYGRGRALSDVFDITAEEVVPPANDDCTDAQPLGAEFSQSVTVTGTIRASSPDTDLETCGDVLDLGFGGVFYTFDGTGGAFLVGLSSGANGTGFFDTILSIYEGDCDSLTCVTGNDQGLGFLDFENIAVVDTVQGTTYYIYVHGFSAVLGDFELTVRQVPLPANDDCESSIEIELGDSVEATTAFATQEDDVTVTFEPCGTSVFGNSSSPGLWYSVIGEGFAVQAAVNAQFDVQLSIFSGSCDDLVCVDGSEGDSDNFFNARITWTAEEGVTYQIFIHGFNGGIGEFDLFYETAIL